MMRAAIGGILAGSIIAFAAPSAKAQEASTYGASLKDTPVYVYNWSGIYGGLHAGGVWGDVNNVARPPFADRVDIGFDGGVVGGQIGAQYQFNNNIVGGVEASYTGMGTSEGHIDCSTNFICASNAKNAYQVVGRLGYARGNFMPYIKGGYANVSINSGSPNVILLTQDTKRFDGFTVGGGLEYAWTDGIIFGVDYSHIELDTEDFSHGIFGADRNVDATLDMVVARVNFKLGWAAAPVPFK